MRFFISLFVLLALAQAVPLSKPAASVAPVAKQDDISFVMGLQMAKPDEHQENYFLKKVLENLVDKEVKVLITYTESNENGKYPSKEIIKPKGKKY